MADSITEDVIKKALAAKLGRKEDGIAIVSMEMSAGSAKGANFMTTLTAVKVKVGSANDEEESEHGFMVKTFPEAEIWKRLLTKSGMFSNEVLIYTDLLPKLRALEPKLNPPKTFYSDCGEGILVMGDLRREGYKMVNVVEGMSNDQVFLVLEQLAFLHATSYHFIKNYPGGEDKFLEDYPTLSRKPWFNHGSEHELADMIQILLADNDQVFCSVLRSVDKTLAERAEAFASTREERAEGCFVRPPSNGFSCLIHNDAYCHNFMFRESEAVAMLDLQLSQLGRPAMDLAYFFWSSVGNYFGGQDIGRLLESYHSVLAEKLEVLGHTPEVYSLEALKRDFEECSVWWLTVSILHATAHLFPRSIPYVDALSDGEDHRKLMRRIKDGRIEDSRTNAKLREAIKGIAEKAARMGVI